MKGQFLSIVTTLIVIVVGIVAIIFAFSAYITFIVKHGGFGYDVDVINIFNHPYFIADVILNLKVDDRLVIEHAIESAYVGSLEGSNSQRFPIFLKDFLDRYKFKYYKVSIDSESNIAEISINPKSCGDSLEGICDLDSFSDIGSCNVGRIEIPEEKNKCHGKNNICCKNDENAYKSLPGAHAIVNCGENNIGICSEDPEINILTLKLSKFPCGLSREKIDDLGKCKNMNSGRTPICCSDKEIAFSEFDFNSVVPLFFKDKLAYMVIQIEGQR